MKRTNKVFSAYELYLLEQIELGKLDAHKCSIVGYPLKRLKYSETIAHLKHLGIIDDWDGSIVIFTDHKLYKHYKFTL